MPGPSSTTVITQAPAAGSSVIVTVTVVRANVIAFSSRLASSWANRSGSAATAGRGPVADLVAAGAPSAPGTWSTIANPLLAAAGRNPSAVVATTSAASVGRMEIDICRASSFVRSSRSPTRRSSRRDSAMITSAACPSSSIAPSWIASAKPRMDVSGVRRSCETASRR